MPGRDPAGIRESGDAIMAGEGAGRTLPPVCPDCSADLHWLTGSTLACQQCTYSTELAQ